MTNEQVVVYTPNYRQSIGFFQTWVIMIRNIIKSRQLILQLFRRDFFMQYKKSFLGMAWVFVGPLIGIISWIFLNRAGILNPGDLRVPFTVYLLLGTSIWGLFMGFYGAAAGTLSAGAGFITQVKYPHESLLIKQTAQTLASFLITFLLNVVVLLIFGIVPSHWILLFPLIVLPLFFLAAGLGLIVSVVSVVFTDLGSITGIMLGLIMYITPIIYDISKVESELLRTVIGLNPLTYLIGGVRDLILYGSMDNPDRFLAASLASFIFFMLSWRLFFVSEDRVIEKMI
jgi:lipopolysaccharide transport system permease protein